MRGEDCDLEDHLRAFSGDVHTGPDLRSTLDAELQRLAFELLAGRSGAAVVMDPADGALLALASSPAPDTTATSGAASRAAASAPEQPLRNRALVSIDGYSPPGSASTVTPRSVSPPVLEAEALTAGPSSLAPIGGVVAPDWALARLGFGQGPVTVTPIQMA